MSDAAERYVLMVGGQVQGVGFRPFVWRLAKEEKLAGFVRNTSGGVRIEIQGPIQALRNFETRLLSELPPLAKITALEKTRVELTEGVAFRIMASEGHAGQNVLVSPDVAVCEACLADIHDPANPRYKYPFTNCTACGPRFSITASIPYDRTATTMACFGMCGLCAAEYENPENRRFHAQPIACPVCGPKVWFVTQAEVKAGATRPTLANCRAALENVASALLAGGIVAIRGLGGFQLACDAANSAAVRELRRRKQRPHKALAVMAPDLAAARVFCRLAPEHEKMLSGNRKPITLCPLKPDSGLAPELAPDCVSLGLMLPYTPLHALLFDCLSAAGRHAPALVMTSANARGEPITLGNREALAKLGQLADAWLLHDRDILCRVDDSVVEPTPAAPIFLRRSRGYVPEPVQMGVFGPSAFGAGAHLKAAFCLTRGNEAFVGQHIGDLDAPANMQFYEEALGHMQKLLETQPELVVHDLHPDFLSSRFAGELAQKLQIPAIALQHHAAHAVACLADNACAEPALALCLDGSGLGTDGAIWGGELLQVDLEQPGWKRLGSLSAFPLPGGEAAIKEPWRIAQALAWQCGLPLLKTGKEGAAVAQLLKKRINCPMTTSCGRLFDAVASLLGLTEHVTYEGQAAMLLEKAAQIWLQRHSPAETVNLKELALAAGHDGLLRLDAGGIFKEAFAMRANGREIGEIAAAFHLALARGFVAMAADAAQATGHTKVALSGGVLQNGLMRTLLTRFLREVNLLPLLHRQIPPGDGGIALGQAVWGVRSALANKNQL